MTQYLYAYAARGIQDYILRGTKLKEMVGASELVEDLSTSVLGDTLKALDVPHIVVSRAAGAARILFEQEEHARRLAAVWPMVVSLKAPGLQVVQAVVEVQNSVLEAVARAERQLSVERNILYPNLPVAGTFTRRCPRTGNPAVAFDNDGTPIDAEALAKRRSVSNRIAHVLDPENNLRWPSEFSQIAGPENAYIAVIHADGNAFGRLFLRLQKLHHCDVDGYAKLCSAITEITQSATRLAVEKTCAPSSLWPGRVLVLAGDDLTAVVRAELAVDFTRTFLTEFTNLSREHLARLQRNFASPLPQCLTASAGIVFVKKSYPFAQAYRLAESLCKFAKTSVAHNASQEAQTFTPPPAALAFYRVTTATTSENFSDILEAELTANGIRLTMAPYVVDASSPGNQPSLEALLTLVHVARKLPRGKLRSLLTSFYESIAKVDRDFERMMAIAREKDRSTADAFDHALRKLTGQRLIARKKPNEDTFVSPIGDLTTLTQIGRDKERRTVEQTVLDKE